MDVGTVLTSVVGGLVGSAATLGINWYLFRVQYYTKRRDDLLKKQLEELLLPLYMAVQEERFDWRALLSSNSVYTPEEWLTDAPKRLKRIRKVIRRRLHLADGPLHKGCLEFLEWLERNFDSEERFQRVTNMVMRGEEDLDQALVRFKRVVEEEYKRKRELYLRKTK
jgi:hypothetical protein